MQGKVDIDNVIRIPTSLEHKFFRYWLEFLRPFHNLTERELQVAAEFLKQRYLLSQGITDEALLDKILMSEEVKRTVRENCTISMQHFQVVIGKLRKSKFIVDGVVNKKFLPNVTKDKNNFKLLLLFDLEK